MQTHNQTKYTTNRVRRSQQEQEDLTREIELLESEIDALKQHQDELASELLNPSALSRHQREIQQLRQSNHRANKEVDSLEETEKSLAEAIASQIKMNHELANTLYVTETMSGQLGTHDQKIVCLQEEEKALLECIKEMHINQIVSTKDDTLASNLSSLFMPVGTQTSNPLYQRQKEGHNHANNH